jgi:1,4-alpha-glucan branching enzyme
MKKHNNSKDGSATNSKLTPVRFEFTDPKATTVCIAGSFNHWHPERKTLHASGTGRWWKETALAPGTYEYCLVVDGRWMPDPLARETVPNPYGGRNSVLTVPVSVEAGHLADAEKLVMRNTAST